MTGRILIADAVAGERIVLRARLAAQAYRVLQASDVTELYEMAARSPDLILLPRRLGPADGLDLCRDLRSRRATRSIPLILRLDRTDCLTRIRAIEAGADAVVGTDAAPALLDARIRNLMRRRINETELVHAAEAASGAGFDEPAEGFRRPARIVLITPRLREGLAWRAALVERMRDHIRVLPDATALSALGREAMPDAIVVADNPEAPQRALQLISDLRCRSHTMRSAILLLQSAPAADRAVSALDIGVCDVIEAGFDADETALRLRRELERKRRNDGARAALRQGMQLAVTDPLTGLFNRRYAMSRLDRIATEARQGGTPFAVLALDLDRFKAVNDSYGHAAGDAVLTEVAARMRACLREGDLLARTGGEEFLALIRAATLGDAKQAADRIRQAVAATPVPAPSAPAGIAVTVSIGLVMGGQDEDTASLLQRADRALYAAKADGRNQVTVWSAAA